MADAAASRANQRSKSNLSIKPRQENTEGNNHSSRAAPNVFVTRHRPPNPQTAREQESNSERGTEGEVVALTVAAVRIRLVISRLASISHNFSLALARAESSEWNNKERRHLAEEWGRVYQRKRTGELLGWVYWASIKRAFFRVHV